MPLAKYSLFCSSFELLYNKIRHRRILEYRHGFTNIHTLLEYSNTRIARAAQLLDLNTFFLFSDESISVTLMNKLGILKIIVCKIFNILSIDTWNFKQLFI